MYVAWSEGVSDVAVEVKGKLLLDGSFPLLKRTICIKL